MLQSDENSVPTAVCDIESSVELKLLFILSLFLPLFLIVALQGRFVLYIDCQRSTTKEPMTSSPWDSGNSETKKKKKKKNNTFTVGGDADLTASPPPPPPLTLTLAEALGFTADEPEEAQIPNPGPNPMRQLTLAEALGLGGRSRARGSGRWKVLLISAVARISALSRRDPMAARNRLGITARNESGGRPLISLMKEMDRAEEMRRRRRRQGKERKGSDRVCQVCRVRNKDAVLVPCGHAYCRVCSREIWINRKSCPLCKSQIAEVLDSF